MSLARNPQLSTQVATDLMAKIEGGGLAVGTRLPTEAQMARDYGVSRAVIREAIAQLRNEGLVETRQGAGAFVLEASARPLRLEAAQDMDLRAFEHLFQLRVPLEVEAAALAATHALAVDRARLQAALTRFDAPQETVDETVAADLEFHRAIALATGNPYFEQFLTVIADRIGHVIRRARAGFAPAELHGLTRAEHGAICAAILAGDPEAARRAMRAHMTGGARRIGLRLGHEGKDR